MFRPSADEVEALVREGKRVPVYAEILADLETPTSAYWKLGSGETHSFLLESVTGGERLARYSFLGARPREIVRGSRRDAGAPNHTELEELRAKLAERPYARLEGMPPFTGGAVGTLAYDLVRSFERLPDENADDLGIDDVFMMLFDQVVAFDHAKNRILIIDHVDAEDGYSVACERITETVRRLKAPTPPIPDSPGGTVSFSSNVSRDNFEDGVRRIIEYIRAGDGVQMVLSQRFSAEVSAHPMALYRALRYLNPSPYMYLLRCGDWDVIGASPEVLVTVEGDTARVRPIAGTRRRGENEDADRALEAELLADEKERAEHIMLVDLGRNDIGRIAQAGTVNVSDLMVVERYSHVMHIVSEVSGKLKPGLDAFDAVRACFPAGTVSGAPKVRAMEIIDELESTRRGIYAGAVGYFGYDGDMDLAIAIRTILLKDGKAHVQAGAGIVFDSVPEREWQECHEKAAAVMLAIEMAEAGELQ
ncbi:MAG: anthranilate synthase component I [Armatimonadota bacterium]|nr:anthranilate synthase component I [Armatimonadota bacterium]